MIGPMLCKIDFSTTKVKVGNRKGTLEGKIDLMIPFFPY
jgi:hypothetical protein